jgi:hypothetical protein
MFVFIIYKCVSNVVWKFFLYPMFYCADLFNRAKTLFMKNTTFDVSDIWWRLYLSAIFIVGIICHRSLLTFVFVSDLVDNCTFRRYFLMSAIVLVSDLCWQLYLSETFVDNCICQRSLLNNSICKLIDFHNSIT